MNTFFEYYLKSIQQFIRRAFLYFALGLIGLGVLCVLIYGYHVQQTSLQKMEQRAYRIDIHVMTALRSAYNNILIAQSVLIEQIKKKNIEKELTGKVLASLINYNTSQLDIWFALEENVAKSLPNHPPGALFVVLKKPEFYHHHANLFLKRDFNIPFKMEDYSVKLFTNDIYLRDKSINWYQNPTKNKGKITYTKMYFDEICSNEWVFTFSKAVYDQTDKLIGVVGLDYGIQAIQNILKNVTSDMGVALVQAEDGTVIFDIPVHGTKLVANEKPHQTIISNHLGGQPDLQEVVAKKKLMHTNVNGNWIVYRAISTLEGQWYFIIYQSAWVFYKSLFPFILALSVLVLLFLGGILYFLKKNKDQFLRPINELLTGLKRDTLIIGSNKSFYGHYPESNVLEVNELVSCINTLFEVVNENFQNYRTELEKNIKSKEELEQLVHTRSEQLIEREKLAALGFMSAGLAHEIKNPLNLICNAAEVIVLQLSKLEKAGIQLDETSARALTRLTESNQIILNNGKRVDNIVKTLLLQVRSTKEGHEHLVDMAELVKTNLDFVLSNYRPRMNNRIKVNIERPSQKLVLRGSPVDLGRAFINIIDNSCYAMVKKINSDSQFTAELDISFQELDKDLVIRIRDNGTGISKADLNQIFTPFYTTKPPGEGTGLGLNFAYEIVKHHGGGLEIFSHFGEFTEIVMTLPYRGNA